MPSLPMIAFIAVIVSALLGLFRRGKFRRLAIAFLWLLPLWGALWFTANHHTDIASEFGVGWAYVAFTPFFMALWSPVTLFPFMPSKRLLQIQREL